MAHAIDYAIEAGGVIKYFNENGGKATVLDRVSLKVGRGQIFGLLGPNGAGKTTLINIFSGLLHADAGRIRVLGLDPKTEREKLAGKINICSGNSSFFVLFTPRELLRYYGLLYGINFMALESRIDRLVQELGITDFQDKQFQSLSTGMKQKVALAKSLINEPELLFLDEPTLGLDVEVARDIRQYITRLATEKKTTILLTSHYLFEVEELCGRIAVINRGALVAEGTADEIKGMTNVGTTVVVAAKEKCKSTKFLEKIPGVNLVSVGGREIVVYLGNVRSSHILIEKIISSLRKEGVDVVDFEVRKATLEEAFMRLINPEE